MKKLFIFAAIYGIIGVSAIAGAQVIDHGSTWHDIVVALGGILLGVCTTLLTLARAAEDNPSIITELNKLDTPK